jgi:hypothetical protein
MKIQAAGIALVAVAVAVSGSNAEICKPCHHKCEIKGDPHVIAFNKEHYKLDPKKGWNNLFTDGKTHVHAKITGNKDGEYIHEVKVNNKHHSSSGCKGHGNLFEHSSHGTKVVGKCRYPKKPMCKKPGVDCKKMHIDVEVTRKHDGKNEKPHVRKLRESGACTHGAEKQSFKCGCGDDTPKPHPKPHHPKPHHKPSEKPTSGPKPHHPKPHHKPSDKPTSEPKPDDPKPHHKPSNKPTPNPTAGPKPGPKPSNKPTCAEVLVEACGESPSKCDTSSMNATELDECYEQEDEYYSCVEENEAELHKACHRLPTFHNTTVNDGECTCTAHCTAKADPHITTFAGARYKTDVGGSKSKMTMYAIEDFSIEASVNDFGKNKEYITEVFHNGESILNIADCKKNLKPVIYEEELSDGSVVKGKVTCHRSPGIDTWYLDIDLAKLFSVKSDAMARGAGYADMYQAAIGGTGECTSVDQGKAGKSKVQCTC